MPSNRSTSQTEHIRLEALDLGAGESKTTFCPFCQASHEDKLYIIKNLHGIFYRCWRASCAAEGFISAGGEAVASVGSKAASKKFVPKRYKGSLELLPHRATVRIYDKYEIDYPTLVDQGVGWAPDKNSLFMPVYSQRGEHVADCLKLLDKPEGDKSVRKVLTLFRKEAPNIHFPLGMRGSKTCVIVEDVLSAIKVSKLLSCVAILGTHLGEEEGVLLAKRYSNLVFMLDEDATDKAVKLAKQWRCLFNTSVIPMTSDPKDTPYVVLANLLENYK